jgi:hypothetical protein
VAQGCVQ